MDIKIQNFGDYKSNHLAESSRHLLNIAIVSKVSRDINEQYNNVQSVVNQPYKYIQHINTNKANW